RDTSVEPARQKVIVWQAAPADVQGIKLEGDARSVEIARRTEGKESYLWATVTRTPPVAVRAPDAGPAPPPPQPTVRGFPVGEEAGKMLLDKLAPLRAERELGALKDADKTDYGLDAPKDKLTVTLVSGAKQLALGARVYGGDDRYALDPATGQVYVL